MEVSSEVRIAFQEASRALAGVAIALEMFAAQVERNGVRADDLKARAPDLLLACACAQGDPWALDHFQAEYLSLAPSFVRGLKLDASALDEVTQRARVKLLAGNPPGIAGYRGRAPLRGWVRVSVARIALDLVAFSNRWEEASLAETVAALEDTPELAAMRHLSRERLQRALDAALQRLAPRKRTILRLYGVDNVNVDGIGVIYGVHRATVARWLVAIRSEIFQSLKADLGLTRPASSSEVRSLVELLRDQIHLSATQLLASPS
jgi:RNA polymerase sigma-70 factor (ECF subfamily)